MKLYELEPATAVIVHPNDADLQIEVREPDVRESLAHSDEYAEAKTTTEKFAASLRFLANHTLAIRGLVDKAGQPIEFKAPIDPERLYPFFRPSFNCTYEKDVEVLDADGKPTGATERKSHTEALAYFAISKLLERETFERPLAPSPSTSSSSNG